jgi:segregation and condensation protein A
MFGVDLPSYHGPLDLLFYLVRREELPIEEIFLSRITSQYLEYVSFLKEFDLDEVGEFIDLTSQLIEIKARSVLPRDPSETDEPMAVSVELESMNHLVDRLMQYKRFRDAASLLDEQSRQWQLRFPRRTNDLPVRKLDALTAPIAKIEVWDLVSAFGRILKANQKPVEHKLQYDNTPIHVHMKRLHELVKEQGELELQNLFQWGMHKSTVIALFIATLELTRHHGLLARQSGNEEPLVLVPGPDFPEELTVAEVENANTEQFRSANMSIMAR